MRLTLVQPEGEAPREAHDHELVLAAQGGDLDAMETLYRRYARRVNGLALRLLGRDSEVDDLVQEAFARTFRALPKLRNPGHFAAFILSTTVRVAHKVVRRRRILTRLGLHDREPIELDALLSSDVQPDTAAELKDLYRAVDAMPADVRIPLLLRRVEKLPLEEVAQLTGVSLATVKRRLAEADRRLEELSS